MGASLEVSGRNSAVVALVMLMITGLDLLYGEVISDRDAVSSDG
jgi:hypothetical protein